MSDVTPPPASGDEPTAPVEPVTEAAAPESAAEPAAWTSPEPAAAPAGAADYTSAPASAAPAPAPVVAADSGGPGWKAWAIAGVAAALVAVGAGYFIGKSDHKGTNTVNAGPVQPGGAGISNTGGPVTGGGEDPANPGGNGGGFGGFAPTQGSITKIDGSTITVKTASGSATVSTDSTTQVLAAVSGTLSQITSGDQITVTGTTTGTTVAATRITQSNGGLFGRGGGRGQGTGAGAGGAPPAGAPTGSTPNGTPPAGGPGGGRFGGGGARGTVTKIDGTTLTITTRQGTTMTVTTTSATKVSLIKTEKLSDLKVGDTITALGGGANGGAARVVIAGTLADLGFGGGRFGGGGPGGNGPGGGGVPTTTN